MYLLHNAQRTRRSVAAKLRNGGRVPLLVSAIDFVHKYLTFIPATSLNSASWFVRQPQGIYSVTYPLTRGANTTNTSLLTARNLSCPMSPPTLER